MHDEPTAASLGKVARLAIGDRILIDGVDHVYLGQNHGGELLLAKRTAGRRTPPRRDPLVRISTRTSRKRIEGRLSLWGRGSHAGER